MTRASDQPIDEIASDALDSGFEGGSVDGVSDDLAESVRSRTEEMARVRAMLRDDTDAPTSAEMSAMLSSALSDARAADLVVSGSRGTHSDSTKVRSAADRSSKYGNRAPWLAAAAAGLVTVLALSVVASGGLGSGNVDEAATASVGDSTGDAVTAGPGETDADEGPGPESVEDAVPSIESGSEARDFDSETSGADQAPDERGAGGDGVAPAVPSTNPEPGTGASRFAGVRVVISVPLD